MKMVSQDKYPLKIVLCVNLKDALLSLQAQITTRLEASPDTILEALCLYSSIKDGQCKIAEQQLLVSGDAKFGSFPTDDEILFWKRVVAVQKALGLEFSFSGDVDKETFGGIGVLYCCLCQKKAVKRRSCAATIGVEELNEEQLVQNIEITAFSNIAEKFVLFGSEVSIQGYLAILGAPFDHVETRDNGKKVIHCFTSGAAEGNIANYYTGVGECPPEGEMPSWVMDKFREAEFIEEILNSER